MSYYFRSESNGSLSVQQWDSPPVGAGWVAFADTDTTAQAAYNDLSEYQLQNGALVNVPTPAATKLANAQTAQIALINAGYAQTIAAGFQCAIGSTTYTFGWQQVDQIHLTQVQQAIDKTIDTFPVQYADIHGTIVSILDQTTLTALDTKANAFSWNQVKQRRTLIANIQAATTIAAVQAITWTPATY